MLPVLAWDNRGEAPAGWGSHVLVHWDEFEPSQGSYRFDLFETALARRDRPCYLQIAFSLYDKVKGAPVDRTARAHKRSLRVQVGGYTGEIPSYDAGWVEAYSRAVEALAGRLKGHAQVRGYWHAAGWSQETQAAMATRTGDWATALRPLLNLETYLNAIRVSTKRAVAAWSFGSAQDAVPVYLPGAPSPGSVWGSSRRRDVIAELLDAGAGYMNCGLATDNDTAWGAGERAGTMMVDIAQRTPRRAFEEGPRHALGEPLEVYWWLLRARHWQADCVNFYGSISAPHAAAVWPLLPKEGVRWLVFRDREFPETSYSTGGKVYGSGGEPGCWGYGLQWLGGGSLTFDPKRYTYDRWQLWTEEPVRIGAPGLSDGVYRVQLWSCDGDAKILEVAVANERFTVPADRVYHRVDLLGLVQPPAREGLPNDEPVATAQKVRYWLEEEARQREQGNAGRADVILYSNIDLAYRLEGASRAV